MPLLPLFLGTYAWQREVIRNEAQKPKKISTTQTKEKKNTTEITEGLIARNLLLHQIARNDVFVRIIF